MEDRIPSKQEIAQQKIEEAAERYWKSEKGKAVQKRYNLTSQGKEAQTRYLQSEKGKAALLRYYLSEKGTETRKRRTELQNLLNQCNKFLEENPDKTIEDFLVLINKEATNR